MAAVDEQLIRRETGLALLFTPPFDRTSLDPGYIKGYPPGIARERRPVHPCGRVVRHRLRHARPGRQSCVAVLNAQPDQPHHHAHGLAAYKVEPYAVAADIYSVAPHVGRGGWTWYTGSAGWLYRAGLESILGFHKQGDHLLLTPCIPTQWRGFEITFRHASARYEIVVENPNGVSRGVVSTVVDDTPLPDGASRILLQDDGATHRVRVTLG